MGVPNVAGPVLAGFLFVSYVLVVRSEDQEREGVADVAAEDGVVVGGL